MRITPAVPHDAPGWPEKKAACLRALAANPRNPGALCELGWLAHQAGEAGAAEIAFRQALSLDPASTTAKFGLATLCLRSGRIDEALGLARACVAASPDDPDGWSLLARLNRADGSVEEALSHLRRAVALAPDDARAAQRLLYQALFSATATPEASRQAHEAWAARFAAPHYPAAPAAIPPAGSGARLRIGYVSPDWKRHPVGQFCEGFLRHHDRTRFEVFCYSCCAEPDARTTELSRLPEHWREAAGWDDAALSARIGQDGVQVLVDLAGHTRGGRLGVFARQPAPVQISYLGYPATSGLATIGYRLTDALADPTGLTEAHHTERLVRIPGSAWCFTPARETPAMAPAPAAARGTITFGNFGQRAKASAPTLDCWARVLRSVSGSRLLWKNPSFRDPAVCARTLARLVAHGVAPERVELRDYTADHAQHLATYGEIDVALDTFPYHGTATTCEALHLGVPVVSLAGATHVSRVGASLLTSAGLAAACLADSPDDYVAKAVVLAGDIAALDRLRRELRPRLEASPLLDAPRFTRHLEGALEGVWREFTAGRADRS